jgi:CIC family chloride channel protein
VLHLLNRLKVSRLPVTEGSKLVGIITRADIIRAESDQVSGELKELGPQAQPSYVVFQQRGPATGQGGLLVPIADPASGQLSDQYGRRHCPKLPLRTGMCTCLQVARSVAPAETRVDLQTLEPLRQIVNRFAATSDCPIHFQVRVAHEIGRTLLEVIKERHIDLVLMGWYQQTLTPGRVIGGVVDTLVRQAPCQVMVVRPGRNLSLNRWLIPTAGGPNAQIAQELLPGLLTLGQAPKFACAVSVTPAKVNA